MNWFHATTCPAENKWKGRSDHRSVLREAFGHQDYRGVQEDVVTAAFEGRDVLGLMPTGQGKSASFQIPAICLPGMTLVISPLIALMKDQVDKLRAAGVRAAALVGRDYMIEEERREVMVLAAAGRLDMLYLSPERLASRDVQALLGSITISMVVIDEAHCVVEWGQDFRKAYLDIPKSLAPVGSAPRIALTASASLPVRKEICRTLLRDPLVCASSFDRPNIALAVVPKSNPSRQLAGLIATRRRAGAFLVYCSSRAQVDDVSEELATAGQRVVAYHAGLEAFQRSEAQHRYLTGQADIAVATAAFGMGVDKPDVGTVAHIGLPSTIEAFYQEGGRGGRDGRQALSWVAWSGADVSWRVSRIAATDDLAARRREIARLETMLGYVEAPLCRRTALLARFGEVFDAGCGRCDRCLSKAPTIDAAQRVRAAVMAVSRMAGAGGVSLAAEILAGLDSERVVKAGLQRIPEFGVLRSVGEKPAKRLVRMALGLAFVEVDERSANLRVTAQGESFLATGGDMKIPMPDRQAPEERLVEGEGLPEEKIRLWRSLLAVRSEREGRAMATDADLARMIASGSAAHVASDGGQADYQAVLDREKRTAAPSRIATGLF